MSSAVRGQEQQVPLVVPRARSFRAPRPIPFALAIGPLVLLTLWAAASATGLLDRRVLSPPWEVVRTAGVLWRSGKLPEHLRASITRAGLGLAIGMATGWLLALISGLTRSGEALLDGTLQLKRAVPTVALIPLLILWFGIGETMKVTTIALAATVPVYVQTHAGLRAIDARYVELARTLRLTRWEFIRHIALPGTLPSVWLGLRLAFTASWLALAVVEQINATSGVGYMMSLARSYGQTEIIMLGLVVYGVFGLCSDGVLRALERRTSKWRRVLAH